MLLFLAMKNTERRERENQFVTKVLVRQLCWKIALLLPILFALKWKMLRPKLEDRSSCGQATAFGYEEGLWLQGIELMVGGQGN